MNKIREVNIKNAHTDKFRTEKGNLWKLSEKKKDHVVASIAPSSEETDSKTHL